MATPSFQFSEAQFGPPQVRFMSALPPKADIDPQSANVRFVPKADISNSSDHLSARAVPSIFVAYTGTPRLRQEHATCNAKTHYQQKRHSRAT